jgi:hypothetical protein
MDINITIDKDKKYNDKIINNDDVLLYIIDKYKLNLEKERKEALFFKCTHRFVILNDDLYCYKCELTNRCKTCKAQAKKEEYINPENLNVSLRQCIKCFAFTEWFKI